MKRLKQPISSDRRKSRRVLSWVGVMGVVAWCWPAGRRRRAGFAARTLVTILIATLAFPLTPAQANTIAVEAKHALDSTVEFARAMAGRSLQIERSQDSMTAAQRAAEVQHLRLCPRKLQLYREETYTLVPTPLDRDKQVLHGVQMWWSSSNDAIASVTSYGEVQARGPGRAIVSLQVGSRQASVLVTVAAGTRPKISDEAWSQIHEGDCDDAEATLTSRLALDDSSDELQRSMARVREQVGSENDLGLRTLRQGSELDSPKALARPASILRASGSKSGLHPSPVGLSASSAAVRAAAMFQENPALFPDALQVGNVLGNPRFSPVEEAANSAIKTKNNLGSSNYGFVAPVLGLGGRGVGLDLSMIYNSQLWGKDRSGATPKMIFDYATLSSAPGWSIGFGRIIPNFDGTAGGDQSGIGSVNPPGNYLLVTADGTRVSLKQEFDSVSGFWNHTSTDGLFTVFNPRSLTMKYADGTVVGYSNINNRVLPTSIKSRNGDVVLINYRPKTSSFSNRYAINQITDSLGRIITFNYYGDPGFPADDPIARPAAALAAVTAPDRSSGSRILMRVEYQNVTLQYNFKSSFLVDGPANNTAIQSVRRIYYPATGQGYLFLDNSSYGMCRYISVRKDMTGAGGTITDGTEVAYTKYNYVDVSTQVGALSRGPEFTARSVWWLGKADGLTPNTYVYSKDTNGDTETDHVLEPTSNLEMLTTSSGGQVLAVEYRNGATSLRTINYVYGFPDSTQLTSYGTTDEAGNFASVAFDYGPYNRVTNIYESGFNGSVMRRTRFQYSDAQQHIDARLLRLVTQVAVFDGPTGALLSKTNYTYDDYAAKGGMEFYGLTPALFPPNHDSSFDQNFMARGNVTGCERFSSVSPNVSTTRFIKYDIFGNVVEQDVSCCQVRTATFSWATNFSQADSLTDGRPGVTPFLTTNIGYDFNTGLVTQSRDSSIDPGLPPVTYSYDFSWQLTAVSGPTGVTVSAGIDRDANGNAQLAYTGQLTYTDNGVSKTVTTKSWFDGGARVIRSGTGAGAAPSSYDAVATEYDRLGRLLRQSNPYLADSLGNGSPSQWTTNEYDALSRVTNVILPDDQPSLPSRIHTDFNGANVTITNQVGRQRTTSYDALGRIVGVTEQDPTTGTLSLTTTNTYDALDNLTQINQGGQIRSFTYDALSRLTNETTPEGGSVSLAYTDFDAVQKMTNARNVETHYKYDSLNRPAQVWYTGVGGDDLGNLRPPLPSGVDATGDVTIAYNTSGPGNGQISSIVDGAGSETYGYDTLARPIRKTRSFTGITSSYTSTYEYNQVGQLVALVYPSGKRIRVNHDSRGRVIGLDKMNGTAVTLSYLSSVTYGVSGQASSLTLGNQVVENFTYNPTRLQLTGQTATNASGAPLIGLSYNYQSQPGEGGIGTGPGNTGQLMHTTGTINSQGRGQDFTYDKMGRLSTASGWGTWQRRYQYDRWGNRTGVWNATSGGTQLQNVSLVMQGSAPNNRIASINGTAYTYDPAGNLTGDGPHTYTYDAANRLTKVDSGLSGSYSYDFGHRRVKRTTSQGTTYYVWEGSVVIAEYSTTGPQTAGGLKFYHPDRLSTRLVTDSNGNPIGTQDHLSFGEEGGTTGQAEKHRFTNYERDSESATDYSVNRQYATDTGKFMQPDFVSGSVFEPQSLNRYVYGYNDPINMSDPDGQFAIAIAAVAILGSGIVGGIIGAIHPPEGRSRWAGFGIGFVSGVVGATAVVLGAATGILPGLIAGGAIGGALSSVTTSLLSKGTMTGDDWKVAGLNAIVGGASAGAFGIIAEHLFPTVGSPIIFPITQKAGGGPAATYMRNLHAMFRARPVSYIPAISDIPESVDNPVAVLQQIFRGPTTGKATWGPNTWRTLSQVASHHTSSQITEGITEAIQEHITIDAPESGAFRGFRSPFADDIPFVWDVTLDRGNLATVNVTRGASGLTIEVIPTPGALLRPIGPIYIDPSKLPPPPR